MSEMLSHIKPKKKVKIKPDAVIVGLGAVGVGGYMFYRRRAANAAAADASTAATDPSTDTSTDSTDSTYDPNSSDYSTADYGDYSGAAYGTTPSLYGYTDPTTGAYIGGYSANQILAPTTNAQWAQQVVALLSQDGYDEVAVTGAVGSYLLGTGLTQNQYQIIQAAIGQEGPPPGGAPTPHIATSTGQTTTKPTTTTATSLPAPHIATAAPHGNIGTVFVVTKTPGAKSYALYRNGKFVRHTTDGVFTVATSKIKDTYYITANNGKIVSGPSNVVTL